MKIECSVVRDLLPLYTEGMVSRETAALVDEHLGECPACSGELARMKEKSRKEEPYRDESAPLRTIRRKLNRKKLGIALLSVVATLALLAAVVLLMPVSVDYGSSEQVSRMDLATAVAAVKFDFLRLTGCKLISLKYAGDEHCRTELEYQNRDRAPGTEYTDCVVFRSVFRSPLLGGGPWNSNRLYTWDWILVRSGGGPWVVLDRGYA